MRRRRRVVEADAPDHNQKYPFVFNGANDDPAVYAELKRLTTTP